MIRRAIIAAMVLAAVTAHGQGRPFSFGIGQTEQVTRGLVSYWAMRNSGTTVYDEKGANNGTATGGVTFAAANGVVGAGSGIAGASSQYITMGNVSALNFDKANPFSISFFTRTANTLSSGALEIVSKQENAIPFRGWALTQRADNYVQFALVNTGSGGADVLSVYSATRVDGNVWKHWVFTYDGSASPSGVKIYVNGQLDGQTTVFNTLTATTQSAASAQVSGRNGANRLWTGDIDEVRIYNVALTAEEIHQLYRMGATVYANR